MGDGAGLDMATCDVTKAAGADPAHFLDIGGSADQDRIEEAFKIIMDDADVEIILGNLFAGIARADIVAQGIVTAAKETNAQLPMVVAIHSSRVDAPRSAAIAASHSGILPGTSDRYQRVMRQAYNRPPPAARPQSGFRASASSRSLSGKPLWRCRSRPSCAKTMNVVVMRTPKRRAAARPTSSLRFRRSTTA